MTDAPKDAPDRYDPKKLLEGVTVEELLQLDGKVFPIFDTFAHSVKRIDETTIVLDEKNHASVFIIDPATGNLYVDDKKPSEKATLRYCITSAINLMRRGLPLDLETKWNEGNSDNWEDRGNEIARKFDQVMDWLRQQVIRAMSETNFGESGSDTVTISFNDSDKTARTMEDLERTNRQYR
jgi:hypothetical protein